MPGSKFFLILNLNKKKIKGKVEIIKVEIFNLNKYTAGNNKKIYFIAFLLFSFISNIIYNRLFKFFKYYNFIKCELYIQVSDNIFFKLLKKIT